MSPFIAELLGTFVLILLGCGVNANNSLNKTYGQGAGWVLITIGWGLAVFCGVFVASHGSFAHLNPAVTVGTIVAGTFDIADAPVYLAGQFLGAALGALAVWLHYRNHYDATDNPAAQLGTFATSPAIPNTFHNLLGEAIGTFTLLLGVFYISGATVGSNSASLGALDGLPVGLLVAVIGMALGGNTGYAINPARDFSPRLIHFLVPMRHKGKSNWHYAWIPIVGPILGAIVAALLFRMIGG